MNKIIIALCSSLFCVSAFAADINSDSNNKNQLEVVKLGKLVVVGIGDEKPIQKPFGAQLNSEEGKSAQKTKGLVVGNAERPIQKSFGAQINSEEGNKIQRAKEIMDQLRSDDESLERSCCWSFSVER